MKLIEFDGIEFKLADEALLVKPIRQLFEKDKSKKKEDFWSQMSYMWFMYDPRSSYQYLTDEESRAQEVKEQEGFGKDWKPSAILDEACKIYQKQTITSASLLVQDMRSGVDTLRALLRSLSGMNAEDPREAAQLAKALTDLVKSIPELAKALVEAEQALAKDFNTDDAARGNAQKSLFEDE